MPRMFTRQPGTHRAHIQTRFLYQSTYLGIETSIPPRPASMPKVTDRDDEWLEAARSTAGLGDALVAGQHRIWTRGLRTTSQNMMQIPIGWLLGRGCAS